MLLIEKYDKSYCKLCFIIIFAKKSVGMETRVQEICKKRGMTLAALAAKIGIKQSNLSQSLKGNPTVGTMQAIADCLEVSLSDLFEEKKEGVHGFLEVNGEVRKIISVKDLAPIVGTFGITSYASYRLCKKDLKKFINSDKNVDTFAAILDGSSLINVFRKEDTRDDGVTYPSFFLSVFNAGRKPQSIVFDSLEYSNGFGQIDWNYLLTTMWAEIIGSLDPEKDYETPEEIKEMALDY